jgi:hypothetical protein
MTPQKFQIKIESILGGHSPMTHFARGDQFLSSLGIDPSLPIDGTGLNYSSISSGLIRPVSVSGSLETTNGSPMWIKANPKSLPVFYIYDTVGSVYSSTGSSITGLGDLNDGGTAAGNGAEYYDNYLYFARSTTVARYGPLDGVPTFTDDYWSTTLGKTALTNNTYPADGYSNITYPNHVMVRHSDGKLYIADVVGNKGTIHFIQTSKTTVEGDTDNGSTYSKLTVGYGLWPTAMESYGSNLAIAFYENQNGVGSRTRAKIGFWDTTSQDINQMVWVEFPDPLITALKNINGILYVFSGNNGSRGFRISRFVGGYTFEEVGYFETGQPPHSGAVDGRGDNLIFGSFSYFPTEAACVYSLGLHKSKLSSGLFNIARDSSGQIGRVVSALGYNVANFDQQGFFFAASYLATIGGNINMTNQEGLSTAAPPIWWSQIYKIGQPFKITKIRIQGTRADGGGSIIPTLYFDDGITTKTLRTINYSSGDNSFVIRPDSATAKMNFWLELKWADAKVWSVALPILIEYELIDD